jgi:hypothetical protein
MASRAGVRWLGAVYLVFGTWGGGGDGGHVTHVASGLPCAHVSGCHMRRGSTSSALISAGDALPLLC